MSKQATPPGASDRRGVLKGLTVLLGGLVGAALAVPALRFLSFPMRRRTVEGTGDPVPVARVDQIPADAPLRVEITAAAQRDAWIKESDVRLGGAWLVRDAGG